MIAEQQSNCSISQHLIAEISQLRADYTALIALRLAAVRDLIQAECSDEADETLFNEAWAVFAGLKGNGLVKALEDPFLDSWIVDTNRLFATGVHKRCRRTYLSRILARFSAIVINSVQLAGLSQASARSMLIGAHGIPVLSGDALVSRQSSGRLIVKWTWMAGVLTIRNATNNDLLLEIAERTDQPRSLVSGWRLQISRPFLSFKVFSGPLSGAQHAAPVAVDTYDSFLGAYPELPVLAQAIIACMINTVALRDDHHPFLGAWLLTLAPVTSEEVLKQLGASLARIMVQVYGFRSAGRLLASDVGLDCVGALGERIARILKSSTGLHQPHSLQLEDLLDICSNPRAGEGALSFSYGRNDIDFVSFARAANVSGSPLDRWSEKRVHSGGEERLVRWELLDAFLTLGRKQQRCLLETIQGSGSQEALDYARACISYNEGDFSASANHLTQCLKADPRCENYWLLLAFCCRHLGFHDLFEEIVFYNARKAEVLGQMWSRINATT